MDQGRPSASTHSECIGCISLLCLVELDCLPPVCRAHCRQRCILQHSWEAWKELQSCLANCNMQILSHASQLCTQDSQYEHKCMWYGSGPLYYDGQVHCLSKALIMSGMRFAACSITYQLSWSFPEAVNFAQWKCKPLLLMQFCAQNFLAESALEAIEAGRAEFAATLMDMGLLPSSFRGWMQQQARSSLPSADITLHEFDSYCNNARIVKAALCAGVLAQAFVALFFCLRSCSFSEWFALGVLSSSCQKVFLCAESLCIHTQTDVLNYARSACLNSCVRHYWDSRHQTALRCCLQMTAALVAECSASHLYFCSTF